MFNFRKKKKSDFLELKVSNIKRETQDTVSISFDTSGIKKSEIDFKAGQYITLKVVVNGESFNRSYSLCSAPFENDFRVAVKEISQGKVSTFLNNELSVGDTLEILPPSGNFKIVDFTNKSYVAFAAGSGITPVISMIKEALAVDAGSRFALFYGNKTAASVIFKRDIDQLAQEYPSRFEVTYLFSREDSENLLYNGRITFAKCKELISQNVEFLKSDGFYLCGPEEMIFGVTDALKELGVNQDKLNFELFTAPSKKKEVVVKSEGNFSGESQLKVIMDGDEFEFKLNTDGEFILNAAMDIGIDAPFSCKGGVCCTCKAQVVEGKATMDVNYSLSDEEVEEGFILTCQARPASEKLVVDYDVS